MKVKVSYIRELICHHISCIRDDILIHRLLESSLNSHELELVSSILVRELSYISLLTNNKKHKKRLLQVANYVATKLTILTNIVGVIPFSSSRTISLLRHDENSRGVARTSIRPYSTMYSPVPIQSITLNTIYSDSIMVADIIYHAYFSYIVDKLNEVLYSKQSITADKNEILQSIDTESSNILKDIHRNRGDLVSIITTSSGWDLLKNSIKDTKYSIVETTDFRNTYFFKEVGILTGEKYTHKIYVSPTIQNRFVFAENPSLVPFVLCYANPRSHVDNGWVVVPEVLLDADTDGRLVIHQHELPLSEVVGQDKTLAAVSQYYKRIYCVDE